MRYWVRWVVIFGLIGGIIIQMISLTRDEQIAMPTAQVREKVVTSLIIKKEQISSANNKGAFLKHQLFRSDRSPYVPPRPKLVLTAEQLKSQKSPTLKKPMEVSVQTGKALPAAESNPFPKIKLVGIIENEEFSFAIIYHTVEQEQSVYRAFDEINGWTLQEISKRSVSFVYKKQNIRLELDVTTPVP
ncbi:MAG: hypothetical protein COB29_14725 [Sulfitobacter sp.]|nr:MAG: hypothetical protein COB29_14725 [Sulfitobacter sp.]